VSGEFCVGTEVTSGSDVGEGDSVIIISVLDDF